MSDQEVNAGRNVRDCVELIRQGRLTSEALCEHYLGVIDDTDREIGAWAWVDRDDVLEQARHADDLRRRGAPLGALHGIPVGLKDIFDTAGQPCERGSAVYRGRIAESNCAVAERLREAGAVILGKTVTTEMAWMNESDTVNPHNHQHGPGGSSSGSAAAVAAGQVPLALGSQTGGSTIRPASYCGVFGFKPTRGVVSRRGVLQTSVTLDQVGMFGLDAGDVALLADVISGYDATDSMSYIDPKPDMLGGYRAEVPVEPVFAWFDMPYADRFSASLNNAFEELLECMAPRVEKLETPRSFTGLLESLRLIYGYEIHQHLGDTWRENGELMSESFHAGMQDAAAITRSQYEDATEARLAAEDWFRQFFMDFDAIVTPAAVAEAPLLGQGTGDPVCCVTWNLVGLPCISLPLLVGEGGLPIGVQLVGAAREDDRLMRTTRWLLDDLRDDGGEM